SMRENLAHALRLLLVTDDIALAGRDPVTTCLAAEAGGVTAVQLRLKRAGDQELASLARELLRRLSVPLFLNDRIDVALAVGAAGVHLGPDDLSPALARRIAPAGFVIGASVGSAAEVARGAAADYWGIGPLHDTATKADAGVALGWEGATALRRLGGERPCVIIGAVTPDDVPLATAAGFAGVAVVTGILGARDVGEAASRYR
ncbi:MAG: thiamine phosphate synthase, partial [Gemmatimonadota bacterium]